MTRELNTFEPLFQRRIADAMFLRGAHEVRLGLNSYTASAKPRRASWMEEDIIVKYSKS